MIKGITKLFLLGSCALIVLMPSIVNAQSKKSSASKPNIIFILTDDLGYGDLGVFFQNQRKEKADQKLPYQFTPNLDKMAASGAQLTNQYCNAPVCAPSRASLLTGLNQGNAKVRDNQFDKQIENNHTIATVLKIAGYATSVIGKWGLQGETKDEPNWPAHPQKRGFDDFFGYMRHADGHEHYPFEGIYRGKKEVWDNYKNVAADLAKCYTTDLWTARAKKWIIDHESAKGPEKPFFMFLAYDSPHAVLELPTQAYPEGKGLKGGIQWLGNPGNMINTASGNVDSFVHPDYKNSTYDNGKVKNAPWPDTFKRYATATRRIDDAVGDILQLLDDLKISENTIVVFTSDNGPSIESYLPAGYPPNNPEFFGGFGPFDGIKRDVWEGGLRMPTLITWAQHIPAGKVVVSPSMLSDWMPTFADVAGISAPARTNGVSLVPSLTGKGIQAESLIYSEYSEGGKTPDFKAFEASRRGRKRGQMQMIRLGDFVGVRYDIKSADDDFEIYDIVSDPKETTNLASIPSCNELQVQMKAKSLQARKADLEAPRPYDRAEIPAVEILDKTYPGLSWKFFKGNFPYVVSETGLTEVSNGISKHLGEEVPKARPGMTLYEGFIKVQSDGEYSFSLQASGKAYMRIHEAELIDADFGYQSVSQETERVYLKAGYHPVKIYYLREAGKERILSLKMRYKDGDWKPLKGTDFYAIR